MWLSMRQNEELFCSLSRKMFDSFELPSAKFKLISVKQTQSQCIRMWSVRAARALTLCVRLSCRCQQAFTDAQRKTQFKKMNETTGKPTLYFCFFLWAWWTSMNCQSIFILWKCRFDFVIELEKCSRSNINWIESEQKEFCFAKFSCERAHERARRVKCDEHEIGSLESIVSDLANDDGSSIHRRKEKNRRKATEKEANESERKSFYANENVAEQTVFRVEQTFLFAQEKTAKKGLRELNCEWK